MGGSASCSSRLLQVSGPTKYNISKDDSGGWIVVVQSPQVCARHGPAPSPSPSPSPSPLACSWNEYNFSSLAGRVFNDSFNDVSSWVSFLSLCRQLPASGSTQPCASNSSSASACAIYEQDPSSVLVFGDFNSTALLPPVWSYVDPQHIDVGVQFSMMGERQCRHPGLSYLQRYTTVVRLLCGDNQNDYITSSSEKDDPCTVFMGLVTPLACTPKPALPQQQRIADA